MINFTLKKYLCKRFCRYCNLLTHYFYQSMRKLKSHIIIILRMAGNTATNAKEIANRDKNMIDTEKRTKRKK